MQEPEGVIVPNTERPLAGKRGLVVDDEFLIVLDLQALLEDSGAEVNCQSSADKARMALDGEGPFDFAIVDLHLGVGIESGVSVAALLAERAIPFVFLSGLASKDPQVTRFNAPLIEKPYRPEALIATIVKAVSGD